MALILREATAVDVLIGPFVDSGDGDTEETALTIEDSDVKLSKNGQAAGDKSDVTTCAHDADGFYNCELDATDTNTIGNLVLYVHVAGALAVRHEFQVVATEIYDALFASDADGFDSSGAVQLPSTSTAGDIADAVWDEARSGHTTQGTYGEMFNQIISGTVDDTATAPTSTAFESDDITETTADHYIGRVLVMTSGSLAGEATTITDYAINGGRGVFTFTAFPSGETVANDDTFVIV